MKKEPEKNAPSSAPAPEAPLDAKELEVCVRLLSRLSTDAELFDNLSEDDRIALLKASGRISRPDRKESRKRVKARRVRARLAKRKLDQVARNKTKIRMARFAPVYSAPKPIPLLEAQSQKKERLENPHACYVCKTEFQDVHFFYDSMCQDCGDFNYAKRFQTAPLEGKTALITGGRVKIGYQSSLIMLRAGARVIVTTRFPVNAAERYAREEDFAKWKDRVEIYGLDLRHAPSVEILARYLVNKEKHLDILVNNAAQTVRRPPGFFAHMQAGEAVRFQDIPDICRPLLKNYEECRQELGGGSRRGAKALLANEMLTTWPEHHPAIGLEAPAKLAMIPYAYDNDTQAGLQIFPEGKLDADLQQVDLREKNTWRLKLAEVATPEMLEVHLINAVAPFILCSKLKPLLLKSPCPHRHIVNVSAMEGKFTRYTKTDKHPHTNMAKAALNMMTATSARDYAADGIYMNAVDTGWVTDEDPAAISARKYEEHDFQPPLDIVDGAARVCDPFLLGFSTGIHAWGNFFKDYKTTDW